MSPGGERGQDPVAAQKPPSDGGLVGLAEVNTLRVFTCSGKAVYEQSGSPRSGRLS